MQIERIENIMTITNAPDPLDFKNSLIYILNDKEDSFYTCFGI